MPANRNAPGPSHSVGPPIIPAPRPSRPVHLAVKSPVRPGTPGYGVLASPVVPRGQLNLRTQPAAPIAHQAGPTSVVAKHSAPYAHPRPHAEVLLKAEHNMPVTHDDQVRAQLAAARANLIQKLYKPPKASGDGGGSTLASIFAPALAARIHGISTLHGIDKIVGNFGSDLVNLGPDTLKGLEGLGVAGAHDLIHPPWEQGYHSALIPAIESAATHDPAFNFLTGHIGRALQEAGQHPLQAGLDVAGGLGAVGRVAGAAGRAGVLGEAARTAASVREPMLMPGGLLPVERHASPNLLKNLALRSADRRTPTTDWMVNHELRRRANEHEAYAQDLQARYEGIARRKAKADGVTNPELVQKRVLAARGDARKQAVIDTVTANGLRKPHGGDIFYSPKGSKLPKRAQLLNEQGANFVKVRMGELGVGGKTGGRAVVIPQALADTMKQHLEINAGPKTALGHGLQTYNKLFRNSVLPFSTKWVVGNTVEAAVRSLLHGVGPSHAGVVDHVIAEMRRSGLNQEADRLEAASLQGTHFALNQRLDRELRQRAYDPSKHVVVRAGQAAARKYSELLPENIFRGNSWIEHQFAKAVLGKHMTDEALRIRRINPGLSNEELTHALARAYSNPAKVAAAGRYSQHVLGKYGAFSPGTRQFIRGVAPFSPWYANAAKFLGTLPVDHPLFTGATLAATRANEKRWAQEHKDVKGLGGDLLSMIKEGKTGYLNIGRYLPQGAFTGGQGAGDLGRVLAGDFGPTLGPQYADAIKAGLLGLDAFNSPLQYPGPKSKRTPTGRVSHAQSHYANPGDGDILTALSQVLAGIAGPVNPIHRVFADRGGTAYNTEKLWDWSPVTKTPKRPLNATNILKGLRRVWDPFLATQVAPHHKRAGSRARSSGGSGGGNSFGGGGGSGGNSFG